MKKNILVAVLWLFSVHLLNAQIPCLPQGITTPGLAQAGTCPPNPTPTPFPTPTPTPAPTPGVDGVIGPKFAVVTVTYAPPGSASSVNYSNSTMLGNSVSLSSSFTNDTSVMPQSVPGLVFSDSE